MAASKSVKYIQYNSGLVSFKIGSAVHALTDKNGMVLFYKSHSKAMQAVSESRSRIFSGDGDRLIDALVSDVIVDFRVHYLNGFDELLASGQVRFGKRISFGSITGVEVKGAASGIWHSTGLEARPVPNSHKSGTRRKLNVLL